MVDSLYLSMPARKAATSAGWRARSISTNFLSRVSRMSRKIACSTMLPPIKIGIISRLMMKVLVRTAELYSREAITQILRMMRSLNGGLGDVLIRGGDADEDVVQGRL